MEKIMDKDLFNEACWDFKKLRLGPDRFRIKTQNEGYIISTCQQVAESKNAIGLITEPGYGVTTAIQSFLKLTGSKYYYTNCSPRHRLRKVLVDFIYLDLPPFIPLHRSSENYLIEALHHIFVNQKRKRIIILHNIQNLGLPDYHVIRNLIDKLKGHVGVVVTINASQFKSLQIKGEKKAYLRDFLTTIDQWIHLSPPSAEELASLCIYRGILAKKIIDRLIRKAPDFKLLNIEIDKIKSLLIERGYLTKIE